MYTLYIVADTIVYVYMFDIHCIHNYPVYYNFYIGKHINQDIQINRNIFNVFNEVYIHLCILKEDIY